MDYPEDQRDFNRRIEREMAELHRQQSQFFSRYQPQIGHRQNPRLAVTLEDADATPTYPVQTLGSSGNTFPIAFYSGGFTHTAGRRTAQFTQHKTTKQAQVHLISNNWVPPGTVLQVWQDRGTDESYTGEWWSDYIDHMRIGVTTEPLAKNANGNVQEWEYEAGGAFGPFGPLDPPGAATDRDWDCLNWCGYDLETNTRVFFIQIGSEAYIVNAECSPE